MKLTGTSRLSPGFPDNDGTVHALREGTAVLVGDFDGVIDRIQVIVYSKQDAPEGYRTVIH